MRRSRSCRHPARCRRRAPRPGQDRVRKLQSSALTRALSVAHVLAMDMADAVAIGARQSHRVSAAPERMSGIEQQMDGRPGMGHEGVDVALRLDDRAHVVMIAELSPCVEACSERSSSRQRRPSRLPAAAARQGALGRPEWRSMSRRNHDGRAGPLVIAIWALGRFEFVIRVAREEFGRIPAADEGETKFGKLVLQRRAVLGNLLPFSMPSTPSCSPR